MCRVLHIIYSASMMLLKIPNFWLVQWSELDSIIATLQSDTLWHMSAGNLNTIQTSTCWHMRSWEPELDSTNTSHDFWPSYTGSVLLLSMSPFRHSCCAINLESSSSTDHLLICHYYVNFSISLSLDSH